MRERDLARYERLEIHEPPALYEANRDFVSLDAWKKAREVKLFFSKRYCLCCQATKSTTSSSKLDARH